MTFESKKRGPFDVLERSSPVAKKTVILFHGYGANAEDLSNLAHYLDPEAQFQWIFPQAPHRLESTPHFESRAWFSLDLNGLQTAIVTKQFETFIQEREFGLDQIRPSVQDFLDCVERPVSELLIGGFSQGSMVALDTVFHQQRSAAALLLFSSTLVSPNKYEVLAKNHQGLPFLQSHGKDDPLLPYYLAEQLFNHLKSSGLEGRFYGFEGGHEIPPLVIQMAAQFLKKF